ncbi:hypothetical protein H6P81_013526 [Aristolochia fimbriata]|uniref:Beta-glucosidase n=1 Tax=Aristolochia fimbriata TaxID=158543 RepID=A0AAV7EEY5_ARIFI|nr:hypothetical protein H6P81_013526 [Aristolochia fimbriata]
MVSIYLILQAVALVLMTAQGASAFTRDDFPPGFVFGAGSSAYQVEGAVAEDGRKPSIWDTFAHAGKVFDRSTADIAADQYHKYKEDVELMHKMGLDAYRFSISWSRLIPDGRGEVNPKGLQYYKNLVDELVKHGIEPHVTLNHFDLPQALEDDYGGYLSPKLIEDFTAYADVCFREFGDKVKTWITFNEPNIQTVLGYDLGVFPPARCSYPFGWNCSEGNSSTEVYISSHYILLAHAAAVKVYREKYQDTQRGSIGITLLGLWFEPYTDSLQDVNATQRILDFHLGWYLDPIVYGDYPASLKEIVKSRLPSFDEEESKQIRGSFDFIGLNHYSVIYVKGSSPDWDKSERDYVTDISAKFSFAKAEDGKKVLLKSFKHLSHSMYKDPTFPSNPWGLQRLLEYIKLNYDNPLVFVHENGYMAVRNSSVSSPNDLDDAERAEYIKTYIEGVLESVRNGSNTRGYFVWSFTDCFELLFGYSSYYGLYQVNFNDAERRRDPRLSAEWYSNFLHSSQRRSFDSYSFRTMVRLYLILLRRLFLVLVVVTACLSGRGAAVFTRDDFPPGFLFGAGSSAYQVEGAAAEDGRKPSIWDTFTHAGKTLDKSTADIAADQYHKYKEDVELMHKMGLDAYRFSISWSRLIPDGHGAVNPKGLQYYNNLINELVAHGIEPHVTLNHFDLPQALDDEYGGYLSPKLVADFTAYADVCFKEFGDRVKTWITFNEPNIQTVVGYDLGLFPPGRCSYPFGLNCSEGNSSTEVYVSAHYILLAHAAAVQLYREKYQDIQRGSIGITLLGMWFEPFSDSRQDVDATQRMLDFHLGWFLDPITHGDYPAIMKKIVGSRLPSFAEEESELLRGSFDFIGLNHYVVLFVQGSSAEWNKSETDYYRDISVQFAISKEDVDRKMFSANFKNFKHSLSEAPTLPSQPWALQRLLEYLQLHYGNPVVFIHENGYAAFRNSSAISPNDLYDAERVEYLKIYIKSMLQSIRKGSNTRGYFVWSFTDCFELVFGYDSYYGLYQVDFNDKERRRYPRLSAKWYSKFLRSSSRPAFNSYLSSE